ncbi:MAG: helicase C-terminal domain-containing protein [Candidatus Pacearchaeota archaeon]
MNSIAFKDEKSKELIDSLTDLSNSIKATKKYKESGSENFYEVKSTPIEELLNIILKNSWILDLIENEESSYLNHMLEVSRLFEDFLDETFFSIENKDNNMVISLVTINLEKRFKEMTEKNKVFIMMSGTLHSESVLKNIFGINNFKIVEAETAKQGELIKCKTGLEKDCSYSNFQSKNITREYYLNSLSKCIDSAKRPTLVHVNSFSDLPTEYEKTLYSITNLASQEELYKLQSEDPLGNRIRAFREKKTDILFTTKCNRGVDFPGDICNSIVITKFPYPNISSIFWKILKKVKPGYFMTFYMDKAKRELLQKVYRGLRSKDDKVYLLSPDLRVLNFDFNQ